MTHYTRTEQNEFGFAFLGDILDWVAKTIEPGDLYTPDVLKGYVRGAFEPGDIFTEAELAEWAEGEGFIREEVTL